MGKQQKPASQTTENQQAKQTETSKPNNRNQQAKQTETSKPNRNQQNPAVTFGSSNDIPFILGQTFGILKCGCFRSKQQCKNFVLFKMKHLYLYTD